MCHIAHRFWLLTLVKPTACSYFWGSSLIFIDSSVPLDCKRECWVAISSFLAFDGIFLLGYLIGDDVGLKLLIFELVGVCLRFLRD